MSLANLFLDATRDQIFQLGNLELVHAGLRFQLSLHRFKRFRKSLALSRLQLLTQLERTPYACHELLDQRIMIC